MSRERTQTLVIFQARQGVLLAVRKYLEHGETSEDLEALRGAQSRYEGLLNKAMGVDHESRVASLEGQRRRRVKERT
jgi:hypothetical protein